LEAGRRQKRLIGVLEDGDGVQSVAASFEVSDEVMARL
jgi:hypothetical protein